jgi:hypothetical protein
VRAGAESPIAWLESVRGIDLGLDTCGVGTGALRTEVRKRARAGMEKCIVGGWG